MAQREILAKKYIKKTFPVQFSTELHVLGQMMQLVKKFVNNKIMLFDVLII